jgi:hypothetical protein
MTNVLALQMLSAPDLDPCAASNVSCKSEASCISDRSSQLEEEIYD